MSRGIESEVKISEDKYVQKDVERMRKAREEKERIKKMTERGITLNESTMKNLKMSPASHF